MPRLNGKPFKSELYGEVAELTHLLIVEQTQHRKAREDLAHAKAKLAEQELLLKKIADLATQDLSDATFERVWEAKQNRHSELFKKARPS